jgi:hypothetical protein
MRGIARLQLGVAWATQRVDAPGMGDSLTQLSSLASGLQTLGLWITLGLGAAFGTLFLLWGHRLGKAASVSLGALCGLLLGTLIGVAAAIVTGQSTGMLGLAGAVLGVAGGGVAGWFLVRTTMVTILGTIVGTLAASLTWTLTAPAPKAPTPKASVLAAAPSVQAEPPASETHATPQVAERSEANADNAAALPPPATEQTSQRAAQPAQASAGKPAAPQPSRVVVGKAPTTATKTLDSKVVEDHGRKRIVIRSRSEVESANEGGLVEGLGALARAASGAKEGEQNASKGPDLSALLTMAKGGQPDPAQLQGMLSQLQAGGGMPAGLGGLGGLPGMDQLGALGGMGGNLQELESQLASTAASLADLVRRVTLSALMGLVVSTLASVGAAFIKKPLVPLTMSLTGAYCIAGAAEAALGLSGVTLPAVWGQVVTIVVVLGATTGGMVYQLGAPMRLTKKARQAAAEERPAFSPLSRTESGLPGAEPISVAGTMAPASGTRTAHAKAAVTPGGGNVPIDPLGPRPTASSDVPSKQAA